MNPHPFVVVAAVESCWASNRDIHPSGIYRLTYSVTPEGMYGVDQQKTGQTNRKKTVLNQYLKAKI